jgi:hypothetical protein
MWRSKKFVLVALLAVVVLVGSIGGVALAQENEEGKPRVTLLARVAEILGIDQQQVEDAFAQARSEARDNRIQDLVDQGKITQEQADQYKAWLQARPDMEPFKQQLREWKQTRPDMPPELEQWQQSRPDIPIGRGFRGHRGHRGLGR